MTRAPEAADLRARLLRWLAPRIIVLAHRLLAVTIRWEFVGERWRPGASPYLLAFWHSRILMMPHAYRGWDGRLLISEHRDGAFIADAVERLGIRSVRGSSTRGGARAMLEMIRWARKGHSLGITPDGPRGPAERVRMGTVALAKKTGLPLRAVCYATRRHVRARSWDRFYIPLPFTRGVFVIGAPVYADAEDDEENLERFQRAMDEVCRRAETYFEKGGRPAA